MKKEKRLVAVANTPEILSAVRLLYAVKEDIGAKNFVMMDYIIKNEHHQLIFRKVPKKHKLKTKK